MCIFLIKNFSFYQFLEPVPSLSFSIKAFKTFINWRRGFLPIVRNLSITCSSVVSKGKGTLFSSIIGTHKILQRPQYSAGSNLLTALRNSWNFFSLLITTLILPPFSFAGQLYHIFCIYSQVHLLSEFFSQKFLDLSITKCRNKYIS